MINPQSSRPLYLQVADELRRQITAKKYGDGERLPAHENLAHELGVSSHTVARAVRQLRSEGLVEQGRGWGTFVRDPWPRKTAKLPSGAVVVSRMPTPLEREAHQIDEGVPVVEVSVGATTTVYPADRWQFTA